LRKLPRQPVDALLRIGIVVLTAFLAWVIAETVREPYITKAGDVAPDFTVTTERGARLTTKDFGGRVLVLNFWASWCAPCIQETPSLNAFQSALRKSGVVVLGISIDTDEQAYKAFLQHFNIGFETARDPDEKISSKYGTFKIPESYIIDKNGVVAAKIISDRNWMEPQVIQFVKSLL
jgi:cytochrome c biogenesis protein CcmG/thiol:disulfide interchange protein DsbE